MDGPARVFNGGPRRSSDDNLEAATNQTNDEIIVDEDCGGNKRRRGNATKTAEEKTANNTENRRKNRQKEKDQINELKEKCKSHEKQINELLEENKTLNRNCTESLEKEKALSSRIQEVEESKTEFRDMQRSMTRLVSILDQTTKNLTSERQVCGNKERIINDLTVQLESLKKFKEKWESQNQSKELQEENKTVYRKYIECLSSRIKDLEEGMETYKADHTQLLLTHNQTSENYTSLRKEYEILKLKGEDQQRRIDEIDFHQDWGSPSKMVLDTNMNNSPQNQN